MNQPTTPTANAILADQSANLRNLEILQKHFPSAIEVTPDGRYTVNAAQLQLALDPAGVKVEEDGFELRWVGKREAYNTAFTPAQNILEPLPEESKNWDTTGNLLLRGDNLDALRLLRHSYFGKVKLIYIDPPYNTQSEAFIYNDNFGVNQTQILEELGYDKDNIEYIKNIYGARTHSGWLSFMYPRLLLAKDLLRDDGVIFISIDDNEQAQLKLLMDEVFGQDNWLGNLIWKNVTDNNPTNIAIEHENILCYGKSKPNLATAWKSKISDVKEKLVGLGKELVAKHPEQKDLEKAYADWLKENKAYLSPLDRYKYIDQGGIYTGSQSVHNPGREGYRYDVIHPKTNKPCKQPLMGYRFPKETMDDLLGKKKILFGDDHTKIIELKIYANEYEDKLSSVINLDGRLGSYELREIFPEVTKIFDNPKPIQLISHLLSYPTENDDLILDFFAGSGTTGEAVMRLNAEDGGNRRFILVQIPQAIDPKKQKEAHRFVTEELGKPATIFEITAERLRRAGAKIEATKPVDTGFRAFDIVQDLDALIFQKPLSQATQEDLAHFEAATLAATPDVQAARQARVLHNLLLAEGLPLTTQITEVIAGKLYIAADVAIFLGAVASNELADTLTALKTSTTPPVYLTIYAPWIADDNFLQNIKTQAESLGFSGDKLRLRG
jgi:adenine-specific DNA-methyltransferase